jgi:hypothetical protein
MADRPVLAPWPRATVTGDAPSPDFDLVRKGARALIGDVAFAHVLRYLSETATQELLATPTGDAASLLPIHARLRALDDIRATLHRLAQEPGSKE